MTSTKLCSVCHAENPAYAVQCQRCGAVFKADETLRTADLWPDQVLRRTPPHLLTPPEGMIALYFIGRGKPLLLQIRDEDITLGRYVPGQVSPTVDLTPHHAGLMGVSRRHAVIRHTETQITITDVGSTNGTWVNETRLTPHESHALESGDQVRLGQFVFYISFTTEE